MLDIKQIIREEIQKVLKEFDYDFGAYRRLIITSPKLSTIQDEIEKLLARPETKRDYADVKYTIKPGVKPNMVVIDMDGKGTTAMVSKMSDIAKKHDKAVQIKIRKERPLK